METWKDLLTLKLQWKTNCSRWCEKLSWSNKNNNNNNLLEYANYLPYKYKECSKNASYINVYVDLIVSLTF